jgi:hypothetical protein
MEIKEFNNMEIDDMTKDELLKEYLYLLEVSNKLSMQMSFIKARMDVVLEKEGEKKYANSLGEFVRITQKRNSFMTTLAKEMLTEEQIQKCIVPKEVSYIQVISAQAKTNREAAMQNDN